MKGNVKKVRRLYNDGASLRALRAVPADAFTLFELFERKLKCIRGTSSKPPLNWRKDWRTDRALRNRKR